MIIVQVGKLDFIIASFNYSSSWSFLCTLNYEVFSLFDQCICVCCTQIVLSLGLIFQVVKKTLYPSPARPAAVLRVCDGTPTIYQFEEVSTDSSQYRPRWLPENGRREYLLDRGETGHLHSVTPPRGGEASRRSCYTARHGSVPGERPSMLPLQNTVAYSKDNQSSSCLSGRLLHFISVVCWGIHPA